MSRTTNSFLFSFTVKDIQTIILLTLICYISPISAQNPCAGVWGGRRPHSSDCTKFYTCVIFIAIEGSCDSGEIFSNATLSCIPGDPSTCQPFVETTLPPPTSPTTTMRTTTPPPSIADICRNVFFAARPHPTSDSLYIGCMRGDGLIFQCFENEVFSRAINECVEKCTVDRNICVGRGIDAIRNPCDCTRFIVCYNDAIFREEECGPNEVFSIDDKELVYRLIKFVLFSNVIDYFLVFVTLGADQEIS